MGQGVKRIKEEVVGIFFILFSVYITLSLISYSKWDPSFFTHSLSPAKNYGGVVGSYISDLLITSLGRIVSYFLPFFFIIYGIKRLFGREKRRELLIGILLLIISAPVLFSLIVETFQIGSEIEFGGILGKEISEFFKRFLSLPGAYIFSLSILLSSFVIMKPISTTTILKKLFIWRKDFHHAPRKIRVVELQKEPQLQHKVEAESQPETSVSTKIKGEYILPSLNLLSTIDTILQPGKNELFERAELLEKKLADFNITGRIVQVHPGPVVTMYEFEPSPGIKISKIVSLADDLGRALGGLSIRIAPIPWKTPLGIEVPNKQHGVVSFREIIGSDIFNNSPSKLTLALGKDIYGRPIVSDLARMPHLLVAGATGSGKSVSINSMVMSIIYKSSPEDVKLLMIDPKLLELSIYGDIPHLIAPVVINPKEATLALKKMVLEMERRYRLIAEVGGRDIKSFNSQVPEGGKLPYIVVIIDELADLMFTASKEVEDSIVRLAQMARASGIHLIVATQRPSVNVITGIIKANFPTRIAFQVSSRVDSRTILDVQGAEQLIGRGDMLLTTPGARLLRLHGAYISEKDIRVVTEFIKSQSAPDYTMFETIQVETPEKVEDELTGEDELYQKVIGYAESIGEISISSIQRRFKVGYNRAARIMQDLEDNGLVGPLKGAGKPRDFIRKI